MSSKKRQKLSKEKSQIQIEVTPKFKLTKNQILLCKLLKDNQTKIVFVDGSPGTAKTYTGILAGLESLNDGSKERIIYIRSAVESSDSSIGFIPGGVEDKFSPYSMPLISKLDELLPIHIGDQLIRTKVIESKPVGFLRGESFRDAFVIIDESQNMTFKELKTILTRIGKNTILLFLGDSGQSDIRKSGFSEIWNMFDRNNSSPHGIHCYKFGREDIVREGVIKFILEVLEEKERYG